MPSKRISFTNFDRRLVLSGGREGMAASNGLRRASGVAQELTGSVLSRWGSQSLFAIDAIQLFYWNGHRYQYNGANLYKDGASIKTGFNGNRLTFNSMPPQPGIQDYLFVLGGGVAPFKIDPTGAITNWGIVEPPNQMQATNEANDQIVIDSFVGSSANYTTTGLTSKADEATIVAIGTGSLALNPAGTTLNLFPWDITQIYGAAQNWGTYGAGHFSLLTDIFQIWIYIDNFGAVQAGTWIEIDVDVNDGTFKKDWYSFGIGLLNPSTTNPLGPHVRRSVQLEQTFQAGQWQQLTWAKSQFVRHGVNTQLDWSMVQALRIRGGTLAVTSAKYYLDNFTLSGGSALGAGPAATGSSTTTVTVANPFGSSSGGATTTATGGGGSEYDYYAVYRNLTTGSQSNPQASPLKLFNVSVNRVQLIHIPVSADPQVSARDLYRTSQLHEAGGGIAFYLDTIYDNTTTTYEDQISDLSVPISTTPWTKNVAVPPATPPTHVSAAAYFIDAGNGYYFKLTTNGTTDMAPPQWAIPTTLWSAVSAFFLNETTSQARANGHFWKVTTAGTSGRVEPDWTLAGPLTDGTVIWTDQGLQVTIDNTAQWTFQGINSTRTLGVDALLFDNAPPLITYDDAAGPFEGGMLWTRDSAPGKSGYIYASPPGRPESVGQSYLVSSTDDPMQKVVIWDGRVWALSTARAFHGDGSYPGFAFGSIDDALGTKVPFTVQAVQFIGIVYWAPDGIRLLNWSGAKLIGFEQLAPIFRGQPEENVPAWNQTNGPLWAARGRNELIFSDGSTMTLALLYDGLMGSGAVWRQPGRILTAAYYEHQTGELAVAYRGGVYVDGGVYLFEHPGQVSDGGLVIPFEIESPGDMPDSGAQFTGQRLLLTLNGNVSGVPQILTPTLIIDGIEHTLPPITTIARTTIDMPIYGYHGRFFDGVRLTGSLLGRVEIFAIEATIALSGASSIPKALRDLLGM
jgi:hypothetical protein